jgi:prepilin-type N-terminal cleavage/methylation domain-containing protein
MPARRSGFTLLEVMVAIVLTSVVAMMAFASARVSVEAASIIQGKLGSVRSDRAARQTLLDLLHNVRPPRARGDTSFALAGDTLTFTAAGAAPLDPEYDWLIAVRPGDDGLSIDARTLGRGPAARAELRLPRVTRWQVRVLPPRGKEWRDQWVPSPLLPSAVAITLWNHDTVLGPPLTIRMSDAASAPAESDYMMMD